MWNTVRARRTAKNAAVLLRKTPSVPSEPEYNFLVSISDVQFVMNGKPVIILDRMLFLRCRIRRHVLVLSHCYFDESGGRGWTRRSEGNPGVSG